LGTINQGLTPIAMAIGGVLGDFIHKAVFEHVTEEQFDSMLSFMEKYNRHWDAEIKKQGVDITNRNDFE